MRGRRIRFGTWADRYERAHISLLRRASSANFRSFLRKWLRPALGSSWLHSIDVAAAQTLVAAMAAEGLHRDSIRSVLALLKRMLATARREGFKATELELRHLRFPKVGTAQREHRCLSVAEMTAIVAAAKQPWQTFFAILATLGLRGSEALAACWKHIDLDRKVMRIRQAASRGKVEATKSKASAADLHLPDELVEQLRAYRAIWAPNGAELLFATSNGRPHWASSVRRLQLRPILKRLGIPRAGLHAFRHGVATALLGSGTPAPVVRDVLRHANLSITLRYWNPSSEDRRLALDAQAKRLTTEPVGRPAIT